VPVCTLNTIDTIYTMYTMFTMSTSGFLTGVYGLWNIYIFALLFLYAPSHKAWANEDNTSTTGEEVEFEVSQGAAGEASEMSSLTDFIRHQATD